MAYTPKSSVQSFQSSWAKTLNWANSQGIPRTAWFPVYQLDAQKLQLGQYPMSEAARTHAILTSANPNDVTPIPTDKPQPTSFWHNAVSDLQNIFTGLMPNKLASNIYDQIKTTLEHPEWLTDPTKNTLAQDIPGVADLGRLQTDGWKSLLEHPFSSALDALPIADGVTSLLGRTAIGDAVASRAGLAAGRQIGELGTIRTVGKIIGNTKLPDALGGGSVLMHDLDGKPVVVRKTVGLRFKQYANNKGLGKDIADDAKQILQTNAKQSAEMVRLVRNFNDIASRKDMSPQDHAAALDLLTQRSLTYDQIRADNSIPVNVKDLALAYQPIEDWAQEQGLAAGDVVKVQMPDGSTQIFANTPGQPVVRTRAALDRAVNELDRKSEVTDRLRDEIQRQDNVATPAFQSFDQIRSQIRQSTKDGNNLPQLLGIPKVTAVQARMVNDLYGEGGLIAQADLAYADSNFPLMNEILRKINTKFKSNALKPASSPIFNTSKQLADSLYAYGKKRAVDEKKFETLMAKPNGVRAATKKFGDAQAKFEKAVHDHPAAIYQPMYVTLLFRNILQHEDGIRAIEEGFKQLKASGVPHETIEQARSNPNTMADLLTTMNKASSESPFGGILSRSLEMEARNSALNELETLRAGGFRPHYIPKVSSQDLAGGLVRDPYRITIPTTKSVSVDSAHARLMDTGDSVYDFVAGVNKNVKQILTRDGATDFIDNYLLPQRAYSQSDLVKLVNNEPDLMAKLTRLQSVASTEAALAQIFREDFNLVSFDPNIYGAHSARIRPGDSYFIDRDIASGLEQSINRSQFPLTGTLAKATGIFRMAILGYSPRYIAHILFGGTFLMALRTSPFAFRFIADAHRLIHDPEALAQIHTTSTQRGVEDPVFHASSTFHEAGGRQLAFLHINEMMNKLGLDPHSWASVFKVIPQIVFKFTNWITDMQRAVTYLDASRREAGRNYFIDPATGDRVTMTAERAHEVGMRSVEKVMGDLQHMTPLERNTFTKIMPFYGWTKHIINYVATYPMDHPYRAMFLSNLANINSADVPTGLPLRIQQLFFLGNPSPMGDVSAVDIRALNPLRDTANYATLSGWLSSLNPAIIAPLAYVDPQIVFGSNVLYPSITYDRLYGVETAPPQGNALTVAEQFVPQIGALDSALKLSGQYRSLAKSNPTAFAKTIFQALNIPFAQVQHLNLKQIAAKQEIDRFNQAKTAAQQAFSGQAPLSSIAGYPTLPNPLNALYSVTPAELASTYNDVLAQTGLPASEVLPSISNPPNL